MPTLDWLNKAQALKAAAQVPYRLLEPQSVHGDPASDNWLIQGDNLDALKALLPFFAGRVKCIYIDPPYNNDPEQKYALRTLPGKYSGLHLLALMYTAFKQIDPTVNSGANFDAEYKITVGARDNLR
jgi:16S rRNA G966 N2-methylase RsmD